MKSVNQALYILDFYAYGLMRNRRYYMMRRKDGGLSIQEQWHLIYQNKKALKRSKFKFDTQDILPYPPFLRNSTLPSLVHFKSNKKQFHHKDQQNHKKIDDRCHKMRYSQSSLEITKLKNQYHRNKLNKQNLDCQKRLGHAMRQFMEENKRWILQGKIKMI